MGAQINTDYSKVQQNYLFSTIAKKVSEFQVANPGKEIFRLGIGDTTQPLGQTVVKAMQDAAARLGDVKTYTGYGAEQGNLPLRQALANQYTSRGVELTADEIFVGDGAKTDSANIQSIFGLDNIVAVSDPAYPVYVDTNVISGRTGSAGKDGRFDGLIYMPCNSDNNFMPELPSRKADLIYLCSPNNPTGAVMSRERLGQFVDYARENKAVIFFDAAYAAFISDPDLPKSIYEIDGAKECAIELNSFSKSHGFTGVRLGWTVVPQKLVAVDALSEIGFTTPGQINGLWKRRQTTFFNGASNVVQAGGLAGLTEEGMKESRELVSFYMENARIIREGLSQTGLKIYGGTDAPFLWMKTPGGVDSWSFFDRLLNETRVVGTPGAGFGQAGEGYFRLSAFGHRDKTIAAVESIKANLKL